ncbi:MAG: AAA family ATPase [Bacteroidales bacterium]|nr:AAA family ATPase [Bacteroidales bacterium]
MIINKLSLKNFMCYYDHKSFEFADGLNIILGHNGDGKSTIFTAFNWIFDQYSHLNLSEVYSKKKYSDILENESFDVYVECIVTQFNDEYKITKSFTVTKYSANTSISRIKEEIWRKDLSTGDNSLDSRTISKLSQQVFPEAFRNFSMFETETDALKIVEGEQLADLVKNFSNAKHYEKLDNVIENFAERADKQFRRESKADKTAQDAIDEIDKKIDATKKEIKNFIDRIEEDEKGRDFYTNKITELVKNLTISDDYKKIEEQIEKLNSEIERARSENKSRNRFTDKIFDEFYILKGFNKIISDFSDKINNLRLEKNRVDNEERNKFAKEKLELENGSTPFPPGFPSLDILKEILKDDICKICNTKLEDSSKEYINKSIKLYEASKKKEKELEMPTIFPNNFIDEFQIIDRTIQLKPEKYSTDRIVEEIEFDLKRITENNTKIAENTKKISDLEIEKKDLLTKIPNITENELKNIRINHEKYSNEKDILVGKIGENKTKLENKNNLLQELHTTRNKTLSQFKESDFKQSTVEVLSTLSVIAKAVKEDEYKKFLKVLSERATKYLKQINVGEITGKIELYKKNDKEVTYKSLNEDNSIRSYLEDSGALQISKPLSILFAIADIASETADNETYPMIFDAPTGRYSPDREQEFFKVLKATKKQRIVVTLRFLGADKTNTPFVNKDLFQHIEKDKAFFIKRVRPFEIDKPETINTEIEVIN